MPRRASLLYVCILVLGATYLDLRATPIQAAPPRRPQAVITQTQRSDDRLPSAVVPRAVIDQYCVGCHNERLKIVGLMLDKADIDHAGSRAEIWEKVLRKLHTREMPPPGRPRPDSATYTAMSAALENMLDDTATANPNPGRVAVHRLNRKEYTNAIRDLLALQIDGKSLLSADEADQEGFDNVA